MQLNLLSFPTRRSSDLRGAQAGDVAVVVGAEDVDQALEAALELVPVVGDVGGQVGRFAVGADQHAVLVVAEGRRARSEEHTSELQSQLHLVCRILLEKT